MQFDPLNIEIIRQLRDGRKSSKDIAEELGVSQNTIRRRISKMIQTGTLTVTGLVDTDTLPNHLLVIVGINFRTRDLRTKAEEISKLSGVIAAGVVTGRYDVMALVMMNNEHDLLRFHTQEISKVEGVTFRETYVMYSNVNWNVPYVL